MNQKSIGYLEIIAAVSIWAASSGIIVRWINQSAEIIYGIGSMIGFIFIGAWILFTGKRNEIKKSFPWWKNLSLIGLFIGINNGLFYIALKLTTVSNAVLTHYFEPILLVLIFAPLILGQKIRKRHLAASLLGFLGLITILLPEINASAFNFGILMGLASAVFFAWHTAIESKLATTTKIDPLTEVLYKNGLPALMFLPFVANQVLTSGISASDWVKLVFFGITVLGISFVLVYKGLSKVASQNASVLFYGEPIGAVILASIVWNEAIKFETLAGGAMILAAGFLAIKNK